MRTFIVQLNHGRTMSITEVEAETFEEAVNVSRETQGYGSVVNVFLKSDHDGYRESGACTPFQFAA